MTPMQVLFAWKKSLSMIRSFQTTKSPIFRDFEEISPIGALDSIFSAPDHENQQAELDNYHDFDTKQGIYEQKCGNNQKNIPRSTLKEWKKQK